MRQRAATHQATDNDEGTGGNGPESMSRQLAMSTARTDEDDAAPRPPVCLACTTLPPHLFAPTASCHARTHRTYRSRHPGRPPPNQGYAPRSPGPCVQHDESKADALLQPRAARRTTRVSEVAGAWNANLQHTRTVETRACTAKAKPAEAVLAERVQVYDAKPNRIGEGCGSRTAVSNSGTRRGAGPDAAERRTLKEPQRGGGLQPKVPCAIVTPCGGEPNGLSVEPVFS